MYHVGVSNIFELLDDENDEEGRKKVVTNVPSTKQVETTQSKQKTTIQTGKEQPRKNEQVTSESSKATPKGERTEKRPRSSEALEGERKNQNRRPREQRPPERKEKSGSSTTNERTEGPKRDNNNKERDNKTPQGQRGTKRVYDRKSGTGRGKEIKKGGGGRRNWGKSEEVWEEKPVEQEVEENKGDGANKTDAVPVQVEVSQESEEEKKRIEEEEKKKKEEEEKEAKLMTYEDYLKKKENEKGEKTSIIPGLPTLRKPGEGVDQKELQQWAKFTAIKRDDEEDKPSGEGKKEKKKESKKQAVPVFFKVQIKKPRNPKSERSESSGKRELKDGSRGGKKGRGGSEKAPNVKDASSFPALSNPPTNKV